MARALAKASVFQVWVMNYGGLNDSSNDDMLQRSPQLAHAGAHDGAGTPFNTQSMTWR
jgi:hypothetical protein